MPNKKIFRKYRPLKLRPKLQQLLAQTDRVKYEPGLEGQYVSEDRCIYVGDRAGPERSVHNLLHELAHFVEIDEARMCCTGWGLHVRQVLVFNQLCYEPQTSQATERELRVIAYQTNLALALGYASRLPSYVTALSWLADYCNVPLADGRLLSEHGPKEVNYERVEASRNRWRLSRARQLQSTYTYERFQQEWHRKLQLLNH